MVLLDSFAVQSQIIRQRISDVRQPRFKIVHHAVNGIVHRGRRIANRGPFDQRIYRGLVELGGGFLVAYFGELGQFLSPVIGQVGVIAQGLDELVVGRGLNFGLDFLDLHLEAGDLPFEPGGRILGVGQIKGLLVAG